MKWATIDIGTNSCRLLILKGNKISNLEVVYQGIESTRIGEGLVTSGVLGVQAMERTVDALRSFLIKVEELEVDETFIMATAAVRRAANQKEFLDLVQHEVGLKVEVLSGEREAYLSYLGVSLGLKEGPKRSLVIDVGGGSTELIWKGKGESVDLISIPIGAVVVTEGNLNQEDIRNQLRSTLGCLDPTGIDGLIAVGGTATSLAAIDLQLDTYDWTKVHGYKLSFKRIQEIFEYLLSLDLQARKKVKGLQANRADIILAGTMIIINIIGFLGVKELFISEKDLLYGKVFEEILSLEEICH